MQVKIIKVKKGPQDDGSYDGAKGTIYVTAWLCDAEVDGKTIRDLKVRVGSQKEGECHNGKYVVDGGFIIPNSQGIKTYNNKVEVYMDGRATKEANGEGYGSGGGGRRESGGATARADSHGWCDRDRSITILSVLKAATEIAVHDAGDDQVDLAHLDEVAVTLLEINDRFNRGEPVKSENMDADALETSPDEDVKF